MVKTYYGCERERTNEGYNLRAFDARSAVGCYQMPLIPKENGIPERLINFNEVLTSKDYGAGVHFFIDDYRFERVWRSPERYIEILRRFKYVLAPDFSLYMDMPMALKIWNVYRSRLIGQMLYRAGVRVIPAVSWAGPETYSFCFDGVEPGGTVAVSSVGVARSPEAREVFKSGMAAMIGLCRPNFVVWYGKVIERCCTVPYVNFENENQKRLLALKGKKTGTRTDTDGHGRTRTGTGKRVIYGRARDVQSDRQMGIW